MNYEEARQSAEGKWNWTNYNDSVSKDHAYVIAPCRDPEPGKPRCDHDTAEEAERHHWKHEVLHIRLVKLDPASIEHIRIRTQRRPDIVAVPARASA